MIIQSIDSQSGESTHAEKMTHYETRKQIHLSTPNEKDVFLENVEALMEETLSF